MGADSFHYPEGYRLEILARTMDSRTVLIQGDLAGRHVVLVTNSSPGETICGLAMPRIVLIDYNIAGFAKLSTEKAEMLPCNPGEIFWDECLRESFAGWVPNEWLDREVQQPWLLKRFEKSEQRHLYAPSSE